MDPSVLRHADANGLLIYFAIVGFLFVGALVFNGSQHWSDWLDETWGRGSIKDHWALGGLTRTMRWRDRHGRSEVDGPGESTWT